MTPDGLAAVDDAPGRPFGVARRAKNLAVERLETWSGGVKTKPDAIGGDDAGGRAANFDDERRWPGAGTGDGRPGRWK